MSLSVMVGHGAGEWLAAGLDLAVRAALVLLCSFTIHVLLGRRRILGRASLWNACLVGLLVLPVATSSLPRVRVYGLGWIGRQLARIEERARAFDHAATGDRPIGRDQFNPARLHDSGHGQPEDSALANRLDSGAGGLRETQGADPRGFASSGLTPNSPSAATNSDLADPWRRHLERDWANVLVLFYLAVGAFLLTRFAFALIAVRRLRRSSCAHRTRKRVGQAPEHWRDWLEVNRPVTLGVSAHVTVPIAAGWLAPVILLPNPLERSNDRRLIDAVLLHELCHIKRGDYMWNIVHKTVSIVYWPHPLVWPLGRVIRRLREEACDELCIGALDGPADYRAALLAAAAGVLSGLQRPGVELGMAMARSTRLGSASPGSSAAAERLVACRRAGAVDPGSRALYAARGFPGVDRRKTIDRSGRFPGSHRTDQRPTGRQAGRRSPPSHPQRRLI